MSSKSKSLVLPSPAKLNLFLHITGVRADGYHQLQTLFQLLDYGDELSFKTNPELGRDEVSLTSNIPELNNEKNLIIRAAKLLRRESCVDKGATVDLKKRLPLGGGIGGGSSNAATTLLALNALWDCGMGVDRLAELGRQLGADVPVFVRGHSAFGEGVGEVLRPVNLMEQWFLVLVPSTSVDTTLMFKHEDLKRDTPPIEASAALDWSGAGRNDFEPLVRRLYPEVDKCMTVLDSLSGNRARMSGSGACVFAAFSSYEQAKGVQTELQSSSSANFGSFIAKGVNVSPVHKALQCAGYPVPKVNS